MARRRRPLEQMDQINLTSMLDLTFVLLIAFMIVAPALRPEIPVEIPEVEEGTKTGKTNDENTIIITIKKKEPGREFARVYTTRTGRRTKTELEVDLKELSDKLGDAKTRNPKVTVTIECDGAADAQTLFRVLGACSAAGIHDVSVPVERPE